MWFRKKETQKQIEEKEKLSIFEALPKIDENIKQSLYENGFNVSVQKKAPKIEGIGMDSTCESEAFSFRTEYGINPYTYNWYGSQAFIGFPTMAIIGQNGWVAKMCNLPAKDSVRKGWEITSLEDIDIDTKIFDEIKYLDRHKFKIKTKLINQSQFTKIFGIRVAVFEVETTDTEYYEKPFNIDGITPNSYKGIKQVDPYWCTPNVTSNNVLDPAELDFYEPTFWMINGKKYHKSHLVITRGEEVADILKPTYQYAGLSLTQKIYERLYGAERTANEVPMLVQSKRTNVYKSETVTQAVANLTEFAAKMKAWISLRDNYGMRFIGADDSIEQIETSLADLDVNIMTQFQLVCGLANIPSYKLLNAPMKGFSSGETEESSYHEELENIQDYTMTPLLDRHYQLLMKSEILPKYNVDFNVFIKWNELDSVTEKERAEINQIKANTDAIYVNAGVLSQYDVNKKIIEDETSDYYGMALVDEEDFVDETPTVEGMDFIKEENGQFFVYSENGEKLSDAYSSKEDAQKRLQEIEYFKNKE